MQCPDEILHQTPDAVLGFRSQGARSVMIDSDGNSRCYTETGEGLSVRDAAKQRKFQGACLRLRRLQPAARVRHVRLVMSVFGTRIEGAWIRKLDALGLSREAEQTVLLEAALAAIGTGHCDA